MTLLEIISKYWTLFVFLVGLVGTWVKFQMTINEHEKRIGEVEKKVDDMTPIWAEIKERLASIEATLKFLTKDK